MIDELIFLNILQLAAMGTSGLQVIQPQQAQQTPQTAQPQVAAAVNQNPSGLIFQNQFGQHVLQV